MRKSGVGTLPGTLQGRQQPVQNPLMMMEDRTISMMQDQPPRQQHQQQLGRLLIAPAGSAILGVVLTPKFFVLALIYLVAAAPPLKYILQLRNNNSPKASPTAAAESSSCTAKDTPRLLGQMVDSSIQTQRSMTIQFALLAMCLFFYEKSRIAVVGRKELGDASTTHAAFRSARVIIMIQHALGLDFEPQLQKYFIGLSLVGNVYYGLMHFVAPAVMMGRMLLYNLDPRYQHRLSFFLMLIIALITFTLLPTMPPRLLARYQREYLLDQSSFNEEDVGLSITDLQKTASMMEPYWNITDTMAKEDTLYNKLHTEGGNPYAAMPSMHTGWALWSANVARATAGTSDRRLLWIWLGIMHVSLTVFFIMVTGNHFWLDAVGGWMTVVVGQFSSKVLTNETVVNKIVSICRSVSWKASSSGDTEIVPLRKNFVVSRTSTPELLCV